MSRYFKAEIAENILLNKDYNLLTFIPLADTTDPSPGQFYMINCALGPYAETAGCQDTYDPLLKRPFSLFRKSESGYQILYRIRGKGTLMLRNLRKGSVVGILGPLGNSYPMPAGNLTALIIAGGLGIASVYMLAEKIIRSGGEAKIHYGARSETDLLMIEKLRVLTKDVYISTDDGSCGERGCVTDMFGEFLKRNTSLASGSVIYACGPGKMLQAVSEIAIGKRINAYVSLEERMACGIGACLGCVVRTVKGYKRVCKEGPVFRADEIVWNDAVT